jgi:hypothetical protein
MTKFTAALHGDFLRSQVSEPQLLKQLNRRDLADVRLEEVRGVHGYAELRLALAWLWTIMISALFDRMLTPAVRD